MVLVALPYGASEEMQKIAVKLKYIDKDAITLHYRSYIQMQVDALFDFIEPEIAMEYVITRGLPPGTFERKASADDLIRCDELVKKLRERISPLNYVCLRDIHYYEALGLKERGVDDSHNWHLEAMKKFDSPRKHLKMEYLEKDMEAALHAEDYEKAAQLQARLNGMKGHPL